MQAQVYMSEVALFTDYKLDESYTPTKISIRVGNTFSDLREARPPLPPGAAACLLGGGACGCFQLAAAACLEAALATGGHVAAWDRGPQQHAAAAAATQRSAAGFC